MHEVAEFLRGIAPFDTLDEAELEQAAEACEIEFYAGGDPVLIQAAEPSRYAWVVRRGALELIADGRTFDLLGEGEMVGHTSMLSGDPVGFTVRAHEDSLLYRLPEDAIRPVLARPAALRYLVRSVGGRYEVRARESGASSADPAGRPVGELLRSEPVIVEPGTTVRDAAGLMVERGSSSVLVHTAEGLGIVTDRDLRTRVVAAGAGPQTTIAEVMTAPARTVTADRTGADVLLEMLDRGVRHFPVLDAHRRVLGVISDTDLMAVESRTPFHLRTAIGRAMDVEELVRAADRLPATVVTLYDARVAAHTLTRVISTVHDALTRRLIELAEQELGAPPVRYAWLALGSFARREAFPSSDQDSALAWEGEGDDAAIETWMAALARRVVEGLARCGIEPCGKGALASKPLFARSLGGWERAARSWLDDPAQEKAGILVSVLVDGRPVWAADVVGQRLATVFSNAQHRPRLLRLLESMALAHRPPTGFFRDFVVDHDGEHRGRLDIKNGGLLPIVDLARVAAMAGGVAAASTLARIDAAETGGMIERRDAAVLRDAFDLITELRMRHQVEQLRSGRAPDDHIDPGDLAPLVRSHLKEAFRGVARVQRGVATAMSLPR